MKIKKEIWQDFLLALLTWNGLCFISYAIAKGKFFLSPLMIILTGFLFAGFMIVIKHKVAGEE